MDSITIKSLTLKPSFGIDSKSNFLVPIDKSGKLVYSQTNDFFKLNELSDVVVVQDPPHASSSQEEEEEEDQKTTKPSFLVYDSTLEKWTNKRIFKEIPIRKTFRNVNVSTIQIKKAWTPKIRIKTTYTFTIQNSCVCPSSLIFTSVICESLPGGGPSVHSSSSSSIHCAVKSISDKQFEVILINYKPEQKVKKDAYKINYIVINQ